LTLQRAGGAAAFSETATAYEETMAPSLRPVAAEVVRRAGLRAGERVIDVGTGTGTAAGMASGHGRRVTGVDAAAGMLDLARAKAPEVSFIEADFSSIPAADGAFDVVLAVHALLFADDRVAALREWLRVAAPRGRLSLSVPGPDAAVPNAIFGPVYDRYGITWGHDYPTEGDVAGWARRAGWTSVQTGSDAGIEIRLANEAQFRTWLRVGARGRATAGWATERREQLIRDLMQAAGRGEGSGFRLPFGAIYLTAEKGS
jgi:SAM-dependent methyltransferase